MRGIEQSIHIPQSDLERAPIDEFITNLDISDGHSEILLKRLLSSDDARIRVKPTEKHGEYTGTIVSKLETIFITVEQLTSDADLDAEWTINDKPSTKTIIALRTEQGDRLLSVAEAKEILLGPDHELPDEKLVSLLRRSQTIENLLERPNIVRVQFRGTILSFLDETEIRSFNDHYQILWKKPRWVVVRRATPLKVRRKEWRTK